jgi:TolA-binding protein
VRVLVFLIFVLFAQDVLAKPTQGLQELRAASALFDAKQYDAALPHFVKAYELSERVPETIFMLAQCERALKMDHSAIVHFREYLKTGPDEARAKEVHAALTVLLEKNAPAKDRFIVRK